MASRHEEKYIIDYRQYVLLKQRAMQLLHPDSHGDHGSYVITSLYYDDPRDGALYEKLEGLPEHSKFRVRTYDYSDQFIKLERKDKFGILTQKQDARVARNQLEALGVAPDDTLSEAAAGLAAQMRAAGLRPVVAVRYRRDAFYHPGSDFRLTFDTELEAISPDLEALFSPQVRGIPVLDGNSVIMEIKYGDRVPVLARKLTDCDSRQLSVSKYALCRDFFTI